MPNINPRDVDSLINFARQEITGLSMRYDSRSDIWLGHIEDMCGAYARAYVAHKETLEAAKRQAELRNDIYFSALALVCGIQIKWIGNALKNTKTAETLEKGTADFFVGNIEDGLKYLVDIGIKSIDKSPNWKKMSSIGMNPVSFRADFVKHLHLTCGEVKGVLEDIHQHLEKDKSLAEYALDQTQGNYFAAKKIIGDYIKNVEEVWLETSDYYVYRPGKFPSNADMAHIFERAIWAKWIPDNIDYDWHMNGGIGEPEVLGTGMFADNPEEAILDRLEYLRIIKPASAKERRDLQERIGREGGTWDRDRKVPVENFGWIDDYEDVVSLVTWANGYPSNPEKIADAPFLNRF